MWTKEYEWKTFLASSASHLLDFMPHLTSSASQFCNSAPHISNLLTFLRFAEYKYTAETVLWNNVL